ncbi:LysE family transporter, partial [bacterium]|nr:LysE family transporter [bacterium]
MFPETLIPTDPSVLLQFFLASGVALAAAAPIGAISILTIQRAISMGFWRAFLPTLGAVTGNGIFGVIAALGTGYLTTSIMGSKIWLRLIGSVILVVMGLRLSTHRKMGKPVADESFGPIQLGMLNFTLVLSNALTLGFYLAAFAVLGLKSAHLFAGESFIMGGGIVFGALIWFISICTAASRFHLKVGDALLGRVRTGVGVLFIILGLVSAVSALVRG